MAAVNHFFHNLDWSLTQIPACHLSYVLTHEDTDPTSADLLNNIVSQPGIMREALILSTRNRASYEHAVTPKRLDGSD